MTSIADRPFDPWRKVAELRLQTIELRDLEIQALRAEADRLAIELRDARIRMEKMGGSA